MSQCRPSGAFSLGDCDGALAPDARNADESSDSAPCERRLPGNRSLNDDSSTKILMPATPAKSSSSYSSSSYSFVGGDETAKNADSSDHVEGGSDDAELFDQDTAREDQKDSSDSHKLNSVKTCGRKGVERKNFSKKVVDELQSWFYSNISHP
jgi:hypothetical protein